MIGGGEVKFKENTTTLLRMYFGLEQWRSARKKDVHGELIRRGVSPYSTEEAVHALLFSVGHAADNRIEEIDAQLDEMTDSYGRTPASLKRAMEEKKNV